MSKQVLAETRFLRLVQEDGWSYVERPNAKGVVTIVPLTDERALVFVEQFRLPLGRNVIEFPAGLVGDEPGQDHEDSVAAAGRELEEETGYRAKTLKLVSASATSAGMANEIVWFVLASGLQKVGPGGGVANEKIKTHTVPLADAAAWLREREKQGLLLSAKIFAGLYFAQEAWGNR